MKTAMTVVTTLAVACFFGCQSASPRGGGMAQDESFKIVVPSTDTQIKQGEIQTVAVTLQRGETFKRDVKLEIKPSKGISVDPMKAVVKAGAKPDVQLRITAAKDAPIGEHKIQIKGTPDKGEPTETEFKITVSDK